MKKVVIVHCWDGHPKYCWYPQTKKALEEKRFKVVVPKMPDTHSPKLSSWLPQLQRTAGRPDENLLLVGHSVGCITILKYLEELKENEKIGGVVLVAGFTEDLGVGYEKLKNFFERSIDFEKIKTKSKYFVAIHSDDDPFVPVKHGDVFKEKLGAKLIIKQNMGHFSGPVDHTKSITSLPDVIEEILRMTS